MVIDSSESDRLLSSSDDTVDSGSGTTNLNKNANSSAGNTFSSTMERLADSNGLEMLKSKLEPYTTKLEIFGWCLYSWASEPFVVTGMGSFVPLFLNEIAQENGVLNSDKLTPCITFKDPNISPPPPPFNGTMNASEVLTDACVLPYKLLGFTKYIDTSSYVMFTYAIAVFFQTVLVILMSGAADRGSHRKSILIGFGIFGALTTMCFYFIKQESYYVATLLCVLANCGFGGVSVCGNSILAVLANNHESVRNFKSQETREGSSNGNDAEEEQEELNVKNNEEKVKIKSTISAKISGSGAGVGYLSAFLVQILALLISFYFKRRNENEHIQNPSRLFPMQFVIAFVGLWWLVFQIPIIFLLKSRHAPPIRMKNMVLPLARDYPNDSIGFYKQMMKYQTRLFFAYISHGVKTLYQAFKKVRQLRDISIFLIGWFLVSDSLTTINSTAILFARTDLKMSLIEASVIGLLTMPAAVIGSIIIPNVIQPYFKINLKQSLLLIIIWASVIPFYGILGMFINSIGLHHPFEMYILAIWYGFALGGIATLARSMYSILIPKNEETIFFALFSITDKGSSILSPIINGLIINKSHDLRNAFWFIIGLLLLSVPVFHYGVDLERGVKEANALETAVLDED